jgi:hypothetical protein
LHQARPAAGNDVAIHLGEIGGHAPGLLIAKGSWLDPRGSEDRHTTAIATRGFETGQIVDHVPESKNRIDEIRYDTLFVGQG